MAATTRFASSALLALASTGCDAGFAKPSRLESVRVLAVQATPASGSPGRSSTLELVHVDGTRGPDAELVEPRGLEIAWFGGCHNPPSRQFFACYPLLTAIAERLAPKLVETSLAGVPPGIFGTGSSFELALPDDILTNAPKTMADPVHYGVSFAFFAVCAGELRPRPDLTDRVPVECVEPDSGRALGHRDFVTGFTTLFSYEGDVPVNQNPVFDALEFDGVRVEEMPASACGEDADCGELVLSEGFEGGCDASSGRCLPRIAPCSQSGGCRERRLLPVVEPSSAESLPGQTAREVVWANFFATAGSFDTPTQLVNDRVSGWVEDPSAYYELPSSAVGRVEFWVTVHDQRGGSAIRRFEILVRDHD